MNINEIIELATNEANKLTTEMDAIFAPYTGILEAPEFMPEHDVVKWDILHKLRSNIFERITRVEQATQTLSHYLKMEVL